MTTLWLRLYDHHQHLVKKLKFQQTLWTTGYILISLTPSLSDYFNHGINALNLDRITITLKLPSYLRADTVQKISLNFMNYQMGFVSVKYGP